MNIVSLFSGAGELDIGLIRAGHQVIWANDIDTETYTLNIGNHIVCGDISIVCGDISEVGLEEIPNCDNVSIPNGFHTSKKFQTNPLCHGWYAGMTMPPHYAVKIEGISATNGKVKNVYTST